MSSPAPRPFSVSFFLSVCLALATLGSLGGCGQLDEAAPAEPVEGVEAAAVSGPVGRALVVAEFEGSFDPVTGALTISNLETEAAPRAFRPGARQTP